MNIKKKDSTKPFTLSPKDQQEINHVKGELFNGHVITWYKLGFWNYIRSVISEDYANKVREEFFESLQEDIQLAMSPSKSIDQMQKEVISLDNFLKSIYKIRDSDMTPTRKVQLIKIINDFLEKQELENKKQELEKLKVYQTCKDIDEFFKDKIKYQELYYQSVINFCHQKNTQGLENMETVIDLIDKENINDEMKAKLKSEVLSIKENKQKLENELQSLLKIDEGLIDEVNLMRLEPFYSKAYASAMKLELPYLKDYKSRVSGFSDEFSYERKVQLIKTDINEMSKHTLDKLKSTYNEICKKAKEGGVYDKFAEQINKYNPYQVPGSNRSPMQKVAFAQKIIDELQKALDEKDKLDQKKPEKPAGDVNLLKDS